MELEQQLQILIENAPSHGVPSVVIEKAIAPVLKVFAQQLQHANYYILQNLTEDWIIFTISDRKEENRNKTVIYAFPTVKDAGQFQGTEDPEILASCLPITHILFRLFSLKNIDSIVFFNESGNIHQGVELYRKDLQTMIEQQLQQLVGKTSSDIA